MLHTVRGVALILACNLYSAAPAAAQDIPPFVPPSVPTPLDRPATGVGPGQPTGAHRGSPVESLEILTGEQWPEAGRERDEIETDRDSFTPATSIASRRRLVVESAYSFVDNRGFKESHSFPELVLRYGLTDRVELRLGWNYETGGEFAEASSDEAGGDQFASRDRLIREHSIQYGVKVGLTEQSRWLPRSVVILQGFTPTGGSAGTSTASQLIATYAAGWELPNRWQFDTAMRYGTASEGGDRFNNWAPSAVLRMPVGEKWAVHGEYFGIFTTGKAGNTTQHYFSPGIHYLVTPNLEVGVRLGWGLNDQSVRFFSNVGFGWRL
jgi:hypothetical protein